MKTVHKYLLPGASNEFGDFTIVMPRGAQFLHADVQHGERTLWAIVDTEEPAEVVRMCLLGTGQEGPPDLDKFTHGGTFYEGAFVWHIFFLPTGNGVEDEVITRTATLQ